MQIHEKPIRHNFSEFWEGYLSILFHLNDGVTTFIEGDRILLREQYQSWFTGRYILADVKRIYAKLEGIRPGYLGVYFSEVERGDGLLQVDDAMLSRWVGAQVWHSPQGELTLY